MNNENSDYKVKVLRTAIIMCWVLLISCFLFKLFGSKVFELAVVDPNFMSVCNWLDMDGLWFRYMLMLLLSVATNTMIILASSLMNRIGIKWILTVISISYVIWFVKFFNPIIGATFECLSFIILPALISKKWWTGFLGLIINTLFQFFSMIIKGADLSTTLTNNTLVALCIALDYYIMVILYYLYVAIINKKKEV